MALTELRHQAVRRSPEELIERMKSFKLAPKFSVGIWFFPRPILDSTKNTLWI